MTVAFRFCVCTWVYVYVQMCMQLVQRLSDMRLQLRSARCGLWQRIGPSCFKMSSPCKSQTLHFSHPSSYDWLCGMPGADRVCPHSLNRCTAALSALHQEPEAVQALCTLMLVLFQEVGNIRGNCVLQSARCVISCDLQYFQASDGDDLPCLTLCL